MSVVIIRNIEPVLFKKQRLWLLEQEDTEECKGLVNLLDHIAYEMERQGELQQLLTEDA
jgi:hypothetical protein